MSVGYSFRPASRQAGNGYAKGVESSSRRASGRRSGRAILGLAAAALLALTPAGSLAQSGADGLFEFSEVPTPQLFELFTAVGDALIERGALSDLSSATDAYAGWLVGKAVDLQPAEGGEGRGYQATGPGGSAYRVFGIRLTDASGAVALPSSAAKADVVALVLITPDNQVGRAGLLTKDIVARILAAGGAVALNDPVWRAEGVTDITPQVFRVLTGE